LIIRNRLIHDAFTKKPGAEYLVIFRRPGCLRETL